MTNRANLVMPRKYQISPILSIISHVSPEFPWATCVTQLALWRTDSIESPAPSGSRRGVRLPSLPNICTCPLFRSRNYRRVPGIPKQNTTLGTSGVP